MILVTTGTNEQPFDRLVLGAAALDVDEDLFVQYGSSTVPHGRGAWVDFVPFDDLAAYASRARVVVCHAGVGSIVLARKAGHRPVVVPRRRRLHEAVDDHQLPLARRLHEAGMVVLVEDVRDLSDAVARSAATAPPRGRSALPGADRLSADVRSVLDGLGVARRDGAAS